MVLSVTSHLVHLRCELFIAGVLEQRILVWALQRNRTNIQVCIHVGIYCKGLACVTMESCKPQDLQGKSKSWKPKKIDGIVPTQNLAAL